MLQMVAEQWVPAAIVVTLPGPPMGWQRVRYNRRTQRFFNGSRLTSYEDRLAAAGALVMGNRPPINGPIWVQVEAHMVIPPSWPKKKRALANSNIIRPTTKPDADNFLKVIDGLSGVVFHDDRLIVKAEVEKRYSDEPKLIVRVWEA